VIAQRPTEDEGATLLLTLAFVFVLGVLFVALGGFAANAMRNTSNFVYQRTLTSDAETMTTASIEYLRSNYGSASFYNPLSPQACPGTSTSIGSSNPTSGMSNSIVLECIATSNALSASSRTVDLYACASGTTVSTCSTSRSLFLHAQVQYDDYDSNDQNTCSASGSQKSCGSGVTISQWDVAYADN
jgi:hypothetical protein